MRKTQKHPFGAIILARLLTSLVVPTYHAPGKSVLLTVKTRNEFAALALSGCAESGTGEPAAWNGMHSSRETGSQSMRET
eukprot:3142209-Rhodomonas_salina.2